LPEVAVDMGAAHKVGMVAEAAQEPMVPIIILVAVVAMATVAGPMQVDIVEAPQIVDAMVPVAEVVATPVVVVVDIAIAMDIQAKQGVWALAEMEIGVLAVALLVVAVADTMAEVEPAEDAAEAMMVVADHLQPLD